MIIEIITIIGAVFFYVGVTGWLVVLAGRSN